MIVRVSGENCKMKLERGFNEDGVKSLHPNIEKIEENFKNST